MFVILRYLSEAHKDNYDVWQLMFCRLPGKDVRHWQKACSRGNLPLVQFLTKRYDITCGDARQNRNAALINAAKNGRLDVFEYLTTRFRMKANDVRIDDNRALHRSAARGHLDMVKYLVKRYAILLKSDNADGHETMRTAGRNGHAAVVRFLLKHVEHWEAAWEAAFCGACEGQQWDVITYLAAYSRWQERPNMFRKEHGDWSDYFRFNVFGLSFTLTQWGNWTNDTQVRQFIRTLT